MIILEHDHARQVVSVGVDPSDQHPILLDQPEPFDHKIRSRTQREGEGEGERVTRRYRLKHPPGVVFLVPATTPLYPHPLARSRILFDLFLPHPQKTEEKKRKTPRLNQTNRDPHGANREISLRRNSAAPGEHIERDSLSKQNVPRFPPYGRDVFDGLERLPFPDMPFYPTLPH